MAKFWMHGALGAIAATAVMSAPAFAQSVIDEMFAKMTASGATVDFDRSQSGDVTTWNDVVVTGPNGDGTVRVDWVREAQNGDAYTITVAPTMTTTFDAEGDEGSVTMSNDGLAYLVNRAGDNLTTAYSAASISMSITVGQELEDFTFSLENVSGNDSIEGAAWNSGSGQLQAGAMRITMSMDDEEVSMTSDGGYDDLSMSYAFSGFAGNMENPEALLNALFQFDMSTGGTSGSGTFGDEGKEVSFTYTGGASNAAFDMSDGSVSYSGDVSDVAYAVNPTALGVPPVDVSLSRAGFALGMPIVKSDEVVDVKYLVELIGLEVSEGIWRMVDPGQTIPRDPADLVFDVTASARWLVSPANLGENPPGAMPFEVEDVTVNEIRLSVGGAEISANGSAELMNGGPFPMPVGRLDIAINGLNGLIDKLTALGLLTPDMILPVRAMMGIYTTPVGEDQMTSSVEMTRDGQILANGLPLPN